MHIAPVGGKKCLVKAGTGVHMSGFPIATAGRCNEQEVPVGTKKRVSKGRHGHPHRREKKRV